jgi:pyridoxamine 5'-phosphate oxidase
MAADIGQLRKEYSLHSLTETGVAALPLDQFTQWWNQAIQSDIEEVNAMALSTINKEGRPESRIVLLKGYSEKGFVFFTNYESNKGDQLQQHAHCSLLFFWKELERQVRINGRAEKISTQESDAYFNSRPEGSKIGAWASPQSQVVESQEWLHENFERIKARYNNNTISRPPHWGGFAVRPDSMEFWQGRPSRMHDRIRYSLQQDGGWKIERLAP